MMLSPMDQRTRLRRLHALAGAVALGAFLVEHVVLNLSGRWLEPAARSPVLAVFEVLFVLAPLAFHAGYGVVLAREPGDATARRQRISGLVVLVFVLLHLGELRLARTFAGLDPAALETVRASHLSRTWGGLPLVALGYIGGLFAACFHFANGSRTAAIRLGWPERAVFRAAAAVASVLFVLGTASVVAAATGSRLLPASDDVTRPCGVPSSPTPSR